MTSRTSSQRHHRLSRSPTGRSHSRRSPSPSFPRRNERDRHQPHPHRSHSSRTNRSYPRRSRSPSLPRPNERDRHQSHRSRTRHRVQNPHRSRTSRDEYRSRSPTRRHTRGLHRSHDDQNRQSCSPSQTAAHATLPQPPPPPPPRLAVSLEISSTPPTQPTFKIPAVPALPNNDDRSSHNPAYKVGTSWSYQSSSSW
ncbi:hypothetical protein BC832DRAFT_545583 [Gaertneriomyces semiglobifer]|nr:hypothetical protein BC832DRAFT_545583 [Gaertneriomyces semiglobifer]